MKLLGRRSGTLERSLYCNPDFAYCGSNQPFFTAGLGKQRWLKETVCAILHMVCLVDNSNERGDNTFIGNRKSKGGTGDYDL